MQFEKPESTQVRVNGINLREFIDSEFLETLERKFNNIKTINLTLFVDDEEETKDMVTISHPFVAMEAENKIIIDVNEPFTLEKIIEVLEEYKK